MDIQASAVPIEHGRDGEAMAEVVHAGIAATGNGADSGGPAELGEDLGDAAGGQPVAADVDEERRRPHCGKQLVTLSAVGAEGLAGGGVQRYLAGLGELAGPDGHHAGAGINVASVQAAGLADAHPAHGQQCDERGVVQRPQRMGERGRRLDQSIDLLGREQVGGDAPVAVGHQLGGRDLGRRVQRAQMPGKDAYHR